MSCGLDEVERRRRLIAAHGRPPRFPDTGAALRLLELRDQVHPRDAIAFVYRDQQAAGAYAASNLDHSGLPSLGTVPVDGGILGVLDLRPALMAKITDPALPDDWTPVRPGPRYGYA